MDIFSFFTTENLIFVLIAISAVGLLLELFDRYTARMSAFLILSSLGTIVLGYFAANWVMPELAIWHYALAVVLGSFITYLAKTCFDIQKITNQLISAQTGSVYQLIERNFDKYAGAATRVQREDYIKNVVDFLRGRELINWVYLVEQTKATFAQTLKQKDTANNLCYNAEDLTNMFVSDILTHLVLIINEDTPLFLQIEPIWEIRNAQATRSFSSLIQRPDVPWLELKSHMSWFYIELVEFMLLWPMVVVKNIRKAFEASIQGLFKSSVKKRLEYFR